MTVPVTVMEIKEEVLVPVPVDRDDDATEGADDPVAEPRGHVPWRFCSAVQAVQGCSTAFC